MFCRRSGELIAINVIVRFTKLVYPAEIVIHVGTVGEVVEIIWETVDAQLEGESTGKEAKGEAVTG